MTTPPDNIVVGITIQPPESLMHYTSNGMNQNAMFLFRMFEALDGFSPILLASEQYAPFSEGEHLDAANPFMAETFMGVAPIRCIRDFTDKYQLNVLLTVHHTPAVPVIKKIKETGCSIIGMAYGHNFMMSLETMAFGHLYDNIRETDVGVHLSVTEPGIFDAIWYSPHFEEARQYIAYSAGVPLNRAFPCPYIWGPEFIEGIMSTAQKEAETEGKDYCNPYFARGDTKNKCIYSLEPNINTVKTALVPTAVTELMHRHRPLDFDKHYIYGAAPTLTQNSKYVDRVKLGPMSDPPGSTHTPKVSFEGRHGMSVVYEKARVHLSHQHHCELNYTFLESLYYGHPLVHNSPFLAHVGYYYHGNNVFDASEMLYRALRHEERDDLGEYNERCEELVYQFSWKNPENQEGYASVLRWAANGYKGEITNPSYIEAQEQAYKYGPGTLAPFPRFVS